MEYARLSGRAFLSMKLQIVHVVRPRPPWRSAEHELTECGLSAAEHESITREAFEKRYREIGRERSAMLTCVTCMQTFERYGGLRDAPATWEADPVAALAREAEKVKWRSRRNEKRERLEIELNALMQLVDQHREEFDTIVARLDWSAKHAKLFDADASVQS